MELPPPPGVHAPGDTFLMFSFVRPFVVVPMHVSLCFKDNRFLLTLSVASATMLISTFVSHTVASLILMPIIVEVSHSCVQSWALDYLRLLFS